MHDMHESITRFRQELRQALWYGRSINDYELHLWTSEKSSNLHQTLNKNLKKENESFLNKISQQLEEANKQSLI